VVAYSETFAEYQTSKRTKRTKGERFYYISLSNYLLHITDKIVVTVTANVSLVLF